MYIYLCISHSFIYVTKISEFRTNLFTKVIWCRIFSYTGKCSTYSKKRESRLLQFFLFPPWIYLDFTCFCSALLWRTSRPLSGQHRKYVLLHRQDETGSSVHSIHLQLLRSGPDPFSSSLVLEISRFLKILLGPKPRENLGTWNSPWEYFQSDLGIFEFMSAFVPPTCNTASHEKVKEESVRRQLVDEKELYCFSELRFYAYASQTWSETQAVKLQKIFEDSSFSNWNTDFY